ncbi:AHH domain-containing protein [Massilia sp. R2A-15]|uniref:AHH domain-containing protein n=1 Tax=Massilia sp. R2A-15 TaxID=3064278 RepID=UPI002734AAB6|nr:AHH domain-containing protein [Massilia sp. R2A-15]WLI89727.1 AHH domain-containing protein [Massilia sp. R2A-15]
MAVLTPASLRWHCRRFVAGGCDLATFATCAAANPVIVGGSVAAGGAVGAAVGPPVMEAGRFLAKNIASVFGVQKQDGQHAHHIVAEGDRRAAVSRKILNNVGMDVNSAWNGMILPARYHQGLHTDTYHISVQAALTGAANYTDAAARLTAIRAQIYMGLFPH